MENFAIPTKLVKELIEIAHNTKNLAIRGLILNGCEWFLEMNDYNDFRMTLEMLKDEDEKLIDYKNAFTQVAKCETRFNNI